VTEARAFAPATLSNLGTGFDVIGLALSGCGDTVTARIVPDPGVRISSITGDNGRLPKDADANTAGIAARETLRRIGVSVGVELDIAKDLPIGSGLGSSAASAVAAAFAVNLAIGSPLRRADLIEPCLLAESAVSGRHCDNVAPALLGGLVLVHSLDPVEIVRLPVPEGLILALVTPDIEVLTRRAREVLPKMVPLAAMTRNSAALAAVVSACHSGDLALLARAIPDEIVTPARAPLIPGCQSVIEAALEAGALASSISGAGPTMFAVCRSVRTADAAIAAMVDAFARHGLRATGFTSPADCPGVRAA
jgi:homoserine kinase